MALIECDAVSLIKEMEDNYIRGDRVLVDVPNVFPDGEVSLTSISKSSIEGGRRRLNRKHIVL